MPNTRKKVIKTVFKDEDDSDKDKEADPFSDSGSEAEIPEHSSSEDNIEPEASSEEEFDKKSKKKFSKPRVVRKPKFANNLISKINRQSCAGDERQVDVLPSLFSVKDLTEADKLLPSFLNLSESDSSDDESAKHQFIPASSFQTQDSDNETECNTEYKDVWSNNIEDSEAIAKKMFMELEQHKSKIEETKASIINYEMSKMSQDGEFNVNDLLAQGEEVLPQTTQKKNIQKTRKARDDSDSEMEDWEEVKDAKTIPEQGLQLVVDFPDAVGRKTKKLDIEMMMKRKINRVKKEYQVYMHKVHVLCWLGHGNFVSRVLNDQEVLAAALSLVPSKDCYPGERVDMKYLEQITIWYKDKLKLSPDKNEEKFRPKAPPLKEILLTQIKSRTITTKKYMIFIFVSMLRAIGLQCRIMFNFVTLPIKPPTSELCSLSTKPKDDKENGTKNEAGKDKDMAQKKCSKKSKPKQRISQVDGIDDSELEINNIIQLDGNDDVKTRIMRPRTKKNINIAVNNDDVSPPKRAKRNPSPKAAESETITVKSKSESADKKKRPKRKGKETAETEKSSKIEKLSISKSMPSSKRPSCQEEPAIEKNDVDIKKEFDLPTVSPRKTRTTSESIKIQNAISTSKTFIKDNPEDKKCEPPMITVTDVKNKTSISSKYFDNNKCTTKRLSLNRNRSQTTNPSTSQILNVKEIKPKARTKSAPSTSKNTSKYFDEVKENPSAAKRSIRPPKREMAQEDKQRVSHRDLLAKNQAKSKNDVTGDLVKIIKKRVKEAKEDSKIGKVKAKIKQESDYDSDHLLEESPKRRNSDEDFKPTKITPKPSTSKKIDRRVLSTDSEGPPINKCNVWCEVFVEELEQWIAVDVIKGKIHCSKEIYDGSTHPVCYIVGWDNNNYLKDLTRRYVPHWNTVTRKQRAEATWWDKAIAPWLGPRTARDKEEDEQLNRMQLEAPLPKSIGEYKNHPLYALKRHLLKFEAIYPPDAATLGFVRNEPVYARDCVYVCRSRDTWLKEAKVVRLGEQPYKIVKARPKWDKLSNKMITDKPLEVFGPWQVQDYEPPVAENGIVPRNAYGNVELFKACMLPKGTVHIKLPGLNRVAKKLNIDCAPAMTGFDFNGGWSHPVYDGFVVCKEYEEIVTEAWVKDQEDQERREREKVEARVYGNWRRLIKGLFIRERLKCKYGFKDPAEPDKKKKGPKLVVKKK